VWRDLRTSPTTWRRRLRSTLAVPPDDRDFKQRFRRCQRGRTGRVCVQPPPATQAGVPFSGVTVQLKDAFGNKVATSSTVSLSLVGTGTLTGGTAQAVDGTGLAAFSNLSVNLVGSKRLVATSSLGVTPDTSVAFTVTPQAASKLSISDPAAGNDDCGCSVFAAACRACSGCVR